MPTTTAACSVSLSTASAVSTSASASAATGDDLAGGGHAVESDTVSTQEIWMGDIPKKYAKTTVLRNLLYKMTPAGVQQPAVKKLVRKGYKTKKARGSSRGGGDGRVCSAQKVGSRSTCCCSLQFPRLQVIARESWFALRLPFAG